MSSTTDRTLQKAIQHHQDGQLKKADALYSKVMHKEPKHAEATHMRGVLKVQQKKYDHAIELLKTASNLSPKDPWVRFHQCELYHSMAQLETAGHYFKEALALGADHPDVHYMLGNTFFDQERFADAVGCYKAALNHSANDLECHLNLANSYEALGQLDPAFEHLSFAAKHQKNIVLELQLIDLLVRREEFGQANQHIRQLSGIKSEHFTQLIQLSKQLLAADRAETASLLLDYAVKLDSGNLSHSEQELYTGLLINLGRYKDARRILEITRTIEPVSALAWFQQGLCEQAAGDFEQATVSHRSALKRDESLGRAAYSLAINGQATVSENELTQWQHQSSATGSNSKEQRTQFLFAIARTRDRQNQTEAAFNAFCEANALHAEENPFDPDGWDRYIDSVISQFSADFFNRVSGMGHGGANLVFILGMPRSGSTLLEAQLTARTGAYGLGEHPTIRRLFMELPEITEQNSSVVACAEHLDATHIDHMRTQYLESLVLHRNNHHAEDSNISEIIYVDKMLGNFLRLGIIAAMFPEARILHSARNAEPTCVSCYTNLFARGLRFTYDLYGLGRAWKSYARLMDHWRQVLPLQMFDVSYEKMVTDPEGSFTEITDFLQLSQVAASESRSDAVSNAGTDIITASFFQARQPVSSSSLYSWKRFESYLEPLYRGLQ